MIRRTSYALLALVLLGVVLLLGVIGSTPGNRLIIDLLREAAAPGLRVTGLDGSILGALCAAEFEYREAAFAVSGTEVCFEANLWTSIDFLKVSLARLDAKALSFQLLEDETATAPGDQAPLSLPVAVELEALAVERLELVGQVMETVSGTLKLDNDNLSSSLSFRFQDHAVNLSSSGPWRALALKAELLNAFVDGRVDLTAAELPYEVAVRSERLDLAAVLDRALVVEDLELQGQGTLDAYELTLNGRVEDPEGVATVGLVAAGDWSRMALSRVRIEDLRAPERRLEVLEADAARVSVDWSSGLALEIEALRGAGALAGERLDMEVPAASWGPEGLSVTAAELRLPEQKGFARIDGSVSSELALDLSVALEGFSLLLLNPELSGVVGGAVNLAGSPTEPRLDGELLAREVAYAGESFESVQLRFSGTEARGSFELEAEGARGRLSSAGSLAMGINDGEATVTVSLLTFLGREWPVGLRLLAPTTFRVAAGRVILPDSCIELYDPSEALDSARLCVDVDYPAGGLNVVLDPWEAPALLLPGSEVALRGRARALLTVSSFSPLAGQGQIELDSLVAEHPNIDPLTLGELRSELALDASGASLVLQTPAEGGQKFVLDGRLAAALRPDLADSPLQGFLKMSLDGIWVAESLLPMGVAFELEDMRGDMLIDARVTGKVGAPLVDASLRLAEAGWRVLALNAEFSDFDLEARIDDSQQLTFTTGGQVGQGTLNVEGDIEGLNEAAPRLSSVFHFENSELIRLPDYTGAISGDLTMTMGTDSLGLTGALELPTARIRIADLPESAVTASADEVIVGTAPAVQQLRTTDVTLTLGDDVELSAFGLEARLFGSLRVREAPGTLRSVTGTIALRDATFNAYGQSLIVDRGQLTFTGEVDNPTVDVVAFKVVPYDGRDFRISLNVTGSAEDLRTVVQSTPQLPEDDALALLLTGRTFSQITSAEQSNVYGAALSMGLLSATGLTQNLATQLRLEEIIVDQDAEGNMEVGAAVRLNRNLYLRYTYGVFSRLGGVLLRYRLNTRFSVQAKTGDAHSIEVRYGVDE
ncbi:MAG: translocation/assembly module TamB domain-containing protein [Pseudomonadota bacterium]